MGDPVEGGEPVVPGTTGVAGDPLSIIDLEGGEKGPPPPTKPPPLLDLEEGEKGPPAPPSPPVVLPPTYPDKIRGTIAMTLIALLTAIVFASFFTIWMGMVFHRVDFKDLKDLLTVVFGPLVALASAAVGYYFGGKPGASG